VIDFSSQIRSIFNIFSTTGRIALHEPQFFGNEKNYVMNAIDSTYVSSVGAYVDSVEQKLAELTHTKRAVAVVNGTAALQIALKLVGVESGEEVITQALSFVATSNSIAYLGASPVFVDVDVDTMGMSPESLNAFLEEFGFIREGKCYNKLSGRRIAACVPMHTFGFMCRIDQIKEICSKWKIPLVEDAAEALGSSLGSQPAGSFGTLSALSFNGNKLVTAGGGGAVITNTEELGNTAKHLTTTAKRAHAYEYYHDTLGYNFRMPNLNAALLFAQLEQLPEMLLRKKRLYETYQFTFPELLKPIPTNTQWNYWLISLELGSKKERDEFLEQSNKAGVMTRPIWKLLYKLPMYEKCQRDHQSNAQWLEDRIVNIPSSAINL
tara:strand:+ start:12300 stop:13439 length:1140 start_codon:yes stop_codon:yes gene_type:complete